jgi:hypothetical protein
MQHLTYLPKQSKKTRMICSFVLFTTLLTLLLSACGSTQSEQQANQHKAELDRLIANARSHGIADSTLQPILNQAKNLSQTSAPLTLFSNQSTTDYYQDLAKRYQILTVQVRGLENQITQEASYQAVQNMQAFQTILTQRQTQGFVEVPTFSNLYHIYSKQLTQAQYPKDYTNISNKAQDATQSLQLLGTAFDKLTSFQRMISLLQNSNMDTSALNQQVNSDIGLLRSATTMSDFNHIITQIDAQLQGTMTFSTQAIPYLGAIKLKGLSQAISTMQQYGGDTTTFQQHLQTDRTLLNNAKTIGDFLKFSSQIDNDLTAIQVPSLQAKANFFVQDYHKQVTAWRTANVYHNPFDGQDYQLGNAYDTLPDDYGEGSAIDDALHSAQTAEDYQGVIDLIQNTEANFKAMQANYLDTTTWNQPHAADKQLMDYYKVTGGTVVVVSELEQAARIYRNGQVIHSAQVVTGEYARPTPPGSTQVFSKQHPVRFISFDAPGSPFYYAPITLQYGLEFHQGGYFLHDVEWRGVFGNSSDHRADLPHADPADQKDGGNGSHGCVNFSPDEAAWLYSNIDYGTPVIVY